MKKKIGRPKMAKGIARGNVIPVRFSEAENKAINEAVRKSGMNRSDWIRAVLLQAASQ